ncbi:MAG: hypothetical protein ACRDTC_27125 [Pseudonocardiaceae bacterium]
MRKVDIDRPHRTVQRLDNPRRRDNLLTTTRPDPAVNDPAGVRI